MGGRIAPAGKKGTLLIILLLVMSCGTLLLPGMGSMANFKHQVGSFVRYNQHNAMVRLSNTGLANDTCLYTSPDIILIIGESYNKRHASLYGYPLETTPRLRRRMEKETSISLMM